MDHLPADTAPAHPGDGTAEGNITSGKPNCQVCGRLLSHANGKHCPRGTGLHPGMDRTCYSLWRAKSNIGSPVPVGYEAAAERLEPRAAVDLVAGVTALEPVSAADALVSRLRSINLCNQADTVTLAAAAADLIAELNPAALALHKKQFEHRANERVAGLERQVAETEALLETVRLREQQLMLAWEQDDVAGLEQVVQALEVQVTDQRATIDQLRAELAQAEQRHLEAAAAAVVAARSEERAAAAAAAEALQVSHAAETDAAIATAVQLARTDLRRELQADYELRLAAVRAEAAAAQELTLSQMRTDHSEAMTTVKAALEQVTQAQHMLISRLPAMAPGEAAAGRAPAAAAPATTPATRPAAESPAATASRRTGGRASSRPAPRKPFTAEPDPAQP